MGASTKWMTSASTQVIGQAELYSVYVSLVHWGERLKGEKVPLWIDNDSARHAPVRRYAPSPASAKLVWEIHCLVTKLKLRLWISRGPTVANPADEPSRLLLKQCAQRWGARLVDVVCPELDG